MAQNGCTIEAFAKQGISVQKPTGAERRVETAFQTSVLAAARF
jgi:hypothetical protein